MKRQADRLKTQHAGEVQELKRHWTIATELAAEGPVGL